MAKFEYKTIVSDFGTNSLNSEGNDGWELVTVIDNRAIFKREIEPDVKIHGPRIDQVILDFDNGKFKIYEKDDLERFLGFLYYCKSQGIEYLLDCTQYAAARGKFFSENIQAILEGYEWEVKTDECKRTTGVVVERIDSDEKERIKKALDEHNGCIPCTAKALGITERTLVRKKKEYGL